ncbi:ribbon-helix-helix protein, CopG family [Nostoc sp. CCY0012]
MSIRITPTAVNGLDELSHERGISRNELIERIGRGLITILDITTSS